MELTFNGSAIVTEKTISQPVELFFAIPDPGKQWTTDRIVRAFLGSGLFMLLL
jgi:hypothetical protein